MSEALKILEANELMRHLILFKLYVDSNGFPKHNINIKDSIKQLYGDDFDNELYKETLDYLYYNKEFTNRYGNYISYKGIDYFESWLKSFNNISDEEIKELERELPLPFFDFFKFTKNTTTVLSFFNQILKLAEKF